MTGYVADNYGQPVAGAAVFVKGTADCTRSDAAGNFTIKAAVNNTLIIQYPGYYTIEHKVRDAKPIALRLEELYIPSPRRIPVLYGEASPKSLVGSVATVYTNQLATTPATLYAYALPRPPGRPVHTAGERFP